MPANRYVILPDAEHNCCYDAEIVDTTRPVVIGGRDFGFERVCEARADYAAVIARALNSHDDLVAALEAAKGWLEGWASAGPQLLVINAALTKAKGDAL